MAANNESPRVPFSASTPADVHYSLPNARPPGAVQNINYGYQYEQQPDLKYINPPSYEEAVKGTYYQNRSGNPIPPEPMDHLNIYRYPDHGQFGPHDSYYYPQSYCPTNAESEPESTTSINPLCRYIVYPLLVIIFLALILQLL